MENKLFEYLMELGVRRKECWRLQLQYVCCRIPLPSYVAGPRQSARYRGHERVEREKGLRRGRRLRDDRSAWRAIGE